MSNKQSRHVIKPVAAGCSFGQPYDFFVRLKDRDILSPSFDEFTELSV